MVFFNYATMQMAAKIVYYGPGLCGKTTNLQYIYQKTSPKSRGEMVSLETETDRTLFFDLLPLDVGNIAGFKTRFQLYTVPGQVFYNSTRKLVLRGVDGIVFVADSQVPMMEANLESLNNLRSNVQELGLNLDDIPLVLQYNKRDLKNVATLEELNHHLNPRELPFFEAAAIQGTGVFETLKGISKSTLIALRKRALGEEKLKIPEIATKPTSPEKPKIATPPPLPRITVPPLTQAAAPPPPAMPQNEAGHEAASYVTQPAPMEAPESHSAVETAPPAPDPALTTSGELAREKVEFAEVATPAPQAEVKKISVKTSDIGSKLDSLRELYTAKPETKPKKQEKFDALSMILGPQKDKTITKKLKIKLEPEEVEAVKNLTIDLQLSGGDFSKRFSNAVNVAVEGKGNPKHVTLEIKLEILKK